MGTNTIFFSPEIVSRREEATVEDILLEEVDAIVLELVVILVVKVVLTREVELKFEGVTLSDKEFARY